MAARVLLRLARWIDAAPGRILAACLLTTAVATFFALRMPIRTDLLDVFPEGNPTIRAFQEFLDDFGMMDGLVLVVTSTDPSPDGLIAAVEEVGEELAASRRIASVDYNLLRSGFPLVWKYFPIYLDAAGIAQLSDRLTPGGIRGQIRKNRETLLMPFPPPAEAEMIAGDPLNLRGILRASFARRALPGMLDMSTGYYMDRDRTFALVFARPVGSSRNVSFVRALYGEVAEIAARVSSRQGRNGSIRIRVAGGYAHAAEAASVIWRDMVVSFVSSVVLVLLLLYLAFRPPVILLAAVVLTLFSALSWTMLFAYVLYRGMNVVTSIVAAMLIGLYVDYVIHAYQRYCAERREGGTSLQALENTFADAGKAFLTSASTTSAGFLAIVVTSFRGLHELGMVAGAGILFCLLSTFLVFGSLLSLLGKGAPARLVAVRPEGFGTAWAQRWIERRWKEVWVVAAVLLLVSAAGAARLRFDSGVEAIGLRSSEVQEVEREVASKTGKRGEPLFLVARGNSDRALDADFDRLEALGERWKRSGAVGSIASPGLLLPPPSTQKEAIRRLDGAKLRGRFPGTELERLLRSEMERAGMTPPEGLSGYAASVRDAIDRVTTAPLEVLAKAGDPRSAYFYNPSRKAIAAHLAPPGGVWEPGALQRMKADAVRSGADFTLTGPPLIFGEIRTVILNESLFAVLLSFAANLVIVYLHFRRIRDLLLVMLPVTAGTILTLGAMGAFSIHFNFFNVAAIALVSGFGVDYGIYFLQSYRAGCGGSIAALRRTGGGITLCAVTTVASCGSILTSNYRGLASIGVVLCIGALFCLLSAVLLLPALLRAIEGRGGGPPAAGGSA